MVVIQYSDTRYLCQTYQILTLDILDTGTYARHSRYLCQTYQILTLDILNTGTFARHTKYLCQTYQILILMLDIPDTYARHSRYLCQTYLSRYLHQTYHILTLDIQDIYARYTRYWYLCQTFQVLMLDIPDTYARHTRHLSQTNKVLHQLDIQDTDSRHIRKLQHSYQKVMAILMKRHVHLLAQSMKILTLFCYVYTQDKRCYFNLMMFLPHLIVIIMFITGALCYTSMYQKAMHESLFDRNFFPCCHCYSDH